MSQTAQLIGWLAISILRARNRWFAALNTAAAGNTAILGRETRFGHDGSVSNLSRKRGHICIGDHCQIRGELLIFAHAGKIEIGDWLYMGPRSTIWSSNESGIRIGSRVLISYDVHIHDTNSHSLNPDIRFEQTRAILTTGHPSSNPGIRSAPIVIGDDVWIGHGARINKGVVIGARAVIGAGSVVEEDVPEDAVIVKSRN